MSETCEKLSRQSKVYGTGRVSKRIMDFVLKDNKSNTRKSKILRKCSVVEFDVPFEAVVDMDKADPEAEKDVDGVVSRGVS